MSITFLGHCLYNNRMAKLALVLANVRSAYNVGAIFRSADAFGVAEIILTGISPYPETPNDTRLPHVAAKAHAMISKTALGAESTIPFRQILKLSDAIADLKAHGYRVYALEQSPKSRPIDKFTPRFPCALIVGSEVKGVPKRILDEVDTILEIPMQGKKESLNVAVAAGIALFELTRTLDKATPAAS